MTLVAAVVALTLTATAALLRAGAASMLSSTRADALHDEAEQVRGAGRIADLLERNHVVSPAINIVHTALLVAAALPAAWWVDQRVEGAALPAMLALMGGFLLLVGDLIPRSIGRRRPGGIAYRLAPLLAVAIRLGAPAVDILPRDEAEPVDGNGDGEDDDSDEIELITSVLEFSEAVVREVMVPRPDMVTVRTTTPISELMQMIDELGYSRFPVVEDSVDDVVGLLIVKDLLPRLAAGDPPKTVAEVMRPIDFVPETKRVPELLKEMQASKSHMAIVVDEYGGTAGLVTIEDLLEELVGEIVDEYDEDELLIEEQSDGTWLVDARLPVSELAEIVGTELPDDEWDTVGGLVLGLAGRVPLEGERFEIDGISLSVVRVQGRRVARLAVEKLRVEAFEDTG